MALSDPGVIWGQKYHLWVYAWKLIFGDWNHQRYIPWWQKIQKSAKNCPERLFLQQLVWYGGAKKWSFRINLSDMEVYTGFLTHPRTKPWIFHTPWMSWGLWKILNFEDCLEKFGCINLHVKKSFFYVLFNFDKIIFLNVTLGQIFWFNSSSAMLLEYINWRKKLNWC